MSRILTIAAAQLGPIQKAEPRSVAVERMVRLLERAHKRGVELVVFPELALTTFFPRHYHDDIAEADRWFETTLPSNETAPLFAAAKRYGIGFHLGYAEIAQEADDTGIVRKLNAGDLAGACDEIPRWHYIHRGRQLVAPVPKVQHGVAVGGGLGAVGEGGCERQQVGR